MLLCNHCISTFPTGKTCRQVLTSDVIKVVAVQLILERGNPHSQHVLVFGRQKLSQLGVIFSLRKTTELVGYSWLQLDKLVNKIDLYMQIPPAPGSILFILFTCTHLFNIA